MVLFYKVHQVLYDSQKCSTLGKTEKSICLSKKTIVQSEK